MVELLLEDTIIVVAYVLKDTMGIIVNLVMFAQQDLINKFARMEEFPQDSGETVSAYVLSIC
jgi:hypothetical protein